MRPNSWQDFIYTLYLSHKNFMRFGAYKEPFLWLSGTAVAVPAIQFGVMWRQFWQNDLVVVWVKSNWSVSEKVVYVGGRHLPWKFGHAMLFRWIPGRRRVGGRSTCFSIGGAEKFSHPQVQVWCWNRIVSCLPVRQLQCVYCWRGNATGEREEKLD